MSKFDGLKVALTRAVGKTSLSLKEKTPEILMGAGVLGVLTSGVFLVRQTLKVRPLIEEHKRELEETKSAIITPTYSEKDLDRDIAKVYVKSGLRFTKHYGPTVSIGLGGLVCLLASNGILRQRNVALMAAYQAVDSSFREYRKRVAEHLGEDKELDIYRGFREEEIEDSETGEVTKIVTADPNGFSPYSKFFDEFSPYWSKTPELNLLFLRNKQNYFNDLLQAKGSVFLSDVYDELGIPKTQASQIVGWSLYNDGDNYIDFGMYDFDSERARAFVNGHERSILLDFNVDGPIIGLLKDQ